MKIVISVIALSIGCLSMYAQVGEHLKDAGVNIKDAAVVGTKKTGNGIKTGLKATGHAVKKGTHKSFRAVAKGADKVADKTETKPETGGTKLH